MVRHTIVDRSRWKPRGVHLVDRTSLVFHNSGAGKFPCMFRFTRVTNCHMAHPSDKCNPFHYSNNAIAKRYEHVCLCVDACTQRQTQINHS